MSYLTPPPRCFVVSSDDSQRLMQCVEASVISFYVKRASMRRSLAFLVVWMLLYVSSPLAATRPNRAYEELQRKYEAALQEIERLRSELAGSRGSRQQAQRRRLLLALVPRAVTFYRPGMRTFSPNATRKPLPHIREPSRQRPVMPGPISIAGWRTLSSAMCSRPMRI